MGDPVRGIITPFVESFDTAIAPATIDDSSQNASQTAALDRFVSSPPPSPERLNHFFSKTDLEKSLEFSRCLTEPGPPDQNTADPQREAPGATRQGLGSLEQDLEC